MIRKTFMALALLALTAMAACANIPKNWHLITGGTFSKSRVQNNGMSSQNRYTFIAVPLVGSKVIAYSRGLPVVDVDVNGDTVTMTLTSAVVWNKKPATLKVIAFTETNTDITGVSKLHFYSYSVSSLDGSKVYFSDGGVASNGFWYMTWEF